MKDKNPETTGALSIRNYNSDFLLSKDWASGSFLVFTDQQDFINAKNKLHELDTSVSNIVTATMDSLGIEYPAWDTWEIQQNPNFISMRKAYERYNYLGLEAGLEPGQIGEIPIIDDVMATMVSPDGLLQIGNEIFYFSENVEAKAPATQISILKDIIYGVIPYRPEHSDGGIEIKTRNTMASCSSDFNFTINHTTKEVNINYSGSSPDGINNILTWSFSDGAGDHDNQTQFTHTFTSIGEKKICVKYIEYGVVKKTGFIYTKYTIDSTITTPNGDTIIKINKVYMTPFSWEEKGIICIAQQCYNLTIGGCTAEFDYTVGIDNVVTFTNKSSTPHGAITGYLWQFGDGTTSNLQNPSHAFPCNKKFNVTLIIYSDQCPNGQESTSHTIDAKGAACCDANPQSNWKESLLFNNEKNKIKYKYDMGVWDFLDFLDQDFKVKMENYEKRNNGKWKKDRSWLRVEVSGNLYAADEDGCTCISPRTLNVPTNAVHEKKYTFKDKLASTFLHPSRLLRMKESSPVVIKYYVDNYLAATQTCQQSPDFQCEQGG